MPLSVTDSGGLKLLTYGYSAGGPLQSLQDSDGGRTDYVYEPVGRLAAVWAPNGDAVTFTLTRVAASSRRRTRTA